MRLNTKKMIATLGLVALTGFSAITAEAITYCNFTTSNNEVTAYANGNINSSAFRYGGFHSKPKTDYSKYVKARITVRRDFYDKYYEDDKALQTSAYNKTKIAGKKDREGIKIELKTYDTNGVSVTSSNSRVISCN